MAFSDDGTIVAARRDMTTYPVQLEVTSPAKFERIQLLVRIVLAVVLGWLGITVGWIATLLFFALPIIAAVVISSRGSELYLTTSTNKIWSALTWLLSFAAYMLLLTDDIPLDNKRVHTELHVTGRPSVGSALARIVMSIPSAFVLFLLGFVSSILWLVALITILVNRTVPRSIESFQNGYLRWAARLAAYHASLVEEYPPFSLSDHKTDVPTAMVNP
jgi:hypothetical protein